MIDPQSKQTEVANLLVHPPLDISLEYSHIYTNELFNLSHAESVRRAKLVVNELVKNQLTVSAIVLIDDYNYSGYGFNPYSLAIELFHAGLMPDYMCFESSLTKQAQELYKLLEDKKLKRGLADHLAVHGLYSCSWLAASWYLCRLGILDFHGNCIDINGSFNFTSPVARKLINVLPTQFKEVEARVADIITASPWPHCNGLIEYVWY